MKTSIFLLTLAGLFASACGGSTAWTLKGSGYNVRAPVPAQIMSEETRVIHTAQGKARWSFLRMKSSPQHAEFIAVGVRWCEKPLDGTNKDRAKEFFESEVEGQRFLDFWRVQAAPQDVGGQKAAAKVEWPENGVILLGATWENDADFGPEMADKYFESLKPNEKAKLGCDD